MENTDNDSTKFNFSSVFKLSIYMYEIKYIIKIDLLKLLDLNTYLQINSVQMDIYIMLVSIEIQF